MDKPTKPCFEAWKLRVNFIVETNIGLGCDDLPDWGYHSAWESGMTPLDAASKAMKLALDF